MKLLYGIIISSLVFSLGCSSNKPKEQPTLKEVDNSSTIKRDYEVRDASSEKKPGWIEDAGLWARQNNEDQGKYTFFSYGTDPKVDREVACKLAKANANEFIAGEIATFIKSQLGESKEGQASINENNPNTQGMREFVESTLGRQVMAMVNGARVEKTYWEKRQYLQKLGAKTDFTGFTCASLIKIENDTLKRAIQKAEQGLEKKADDPETKENVKKALKDVDEAFIKSRQGQI